MKKKDSRNYMWKIDKLLKKRANIETIDLELNKVENKIIKDLKDKSKVIFRG